MKDSKTYFERVLGKYISDIGDLIKESSGIEKVRNLESFIGKEFPEDFVELYSNCDGENENAFGLFAGLEFLDIDLIANDYKMLLDSAYTVFSDKKDVIKEGRYRKGWLPFASDAGGSYLVLDLEPDKAGKYGQVITIDTESDISYVVANSLKEFIDFIEKSFQDSKLVVTENEGIKVVEWKSGHFFDDIMTLRKTVIEKPETFEVEGFWKNYLKEDLVEGKISSNELAKRRSVFIKLDNSNFNTMDELSLEILEHMPNLNELIIHGKNINNFSFLKNLVSIKKLIIGSEKFQETDLEYIRELSGLKELTLRHMTLKDIGSLNNLKLLKSLSLLKIKDFNGNGLSTLKNLTNLCLENISNIELSCVSELKKMKELELKGIEIFNLDFLKPLKKLVKFESDRKANDESNTHVFEELVNLKELLYPIGDMEIIKNCAKLKQLAVDVPKIKNLHYLEMLNITSVTLHNASSKENAEETIQKISNHCKLASYGWQVTWEDARR